MRIGLVQSNTGRSADENIQELDLLFSPLKNADVIVTPECTNIMGYTAKTDKLSSAADDKVVQFICNWARENSTYVIIGSAIILNEAGKPVNRQLVVDPQGSIISHYDKIHMFDVNLPNGEIFRESDRTIAGREAVITNILDQKFGHSICFDLRFPSLFSALSQAGAEILVVPAAFTQSTGRAHWEILLRARAIENGAYVIAPAQTGAYRHSDGTTRHCWGHSLVVSPWGEVLANLGTEPNSQIIEIDLERVSQARSDIPIIKSAQKIAKPRIVKP